MTCGYTLPWREFWAKPVLSDQGRKFSRLEAWLYLTNALAAGMDDQEAGLPDGTIRAHVGLISPQVVKRHSHIRRQELNRAAAALEPKFLKQVLVITPDVADGTTVQ
jgi:hypothetical protein